MTTTYYQNLSFLLTNYALYLSSIKVCFQVLCRNLHCSLTRAIRETIALYLVKYLEGPFSTLNTIQVLTMCIHLVFEFGFSM